MRGEYAANRAHPGFQAMFGPGAATLGRCSPSKGSITHCGTPRGPSATSGNWRQEGKCEIRICFLEAASCPPHRARAVRAEEVTGGGLEQTGGNPPRKRHRHARPGTGPARPCAHERLAGARARGGCRPAPRPAGSPQDLAHWESHSFGSLLEGSPRRRFSVVERPCDAPGL